MATAAPGLVAVQKCRYPAPPIRRSLDSIFFKPLRGAQATEQPVAGTRNPAIYPRGDTMSKGMDTKKNAKKKPLKTAQEKRVAKREKANGATPLLGSHAAR